MTLSFSRPSVTQVKDEQKGSPHIYSNVLCFLHEPTDPSAVATVAPFTELQIHMRPRKTQKIPAVLARHAAVGLRAWSGVGAGLERVDARGDGKGESREEGGDEDGETHDENRSADEKYADGCDGVECRLLIQSGRW
jgi:hypothetical protein